jgi:magnesium transporter
LTGFFGQNFTHLPYGNDALMYGVVGSCFLIPMGMVIWFRRKHWL